MRYTEIHSISGGRHSIAVPAPRPYTRDSAFSMRRSSDLCVNYVSAYCRCRLYAALVLYTEQVRSSDRCLAHFAEFRGDWSICTEREGLFFILHCVYIRICLQLFYCLNSRRRETGAATPSRVRVTDRGSDCFRDGRIRIFA